MMPEWNYEVGILYSNRLGNVRVLLNKVPEKSLFYVTQKKIDAQSKPLNPNEMI